MTRTIGTLMAARTAPTSSQTFATWDSAAKAATITLTNGDLTAESDGSTVDAVRTTISKATGKHYIELFLNVKGGLSLSVGARTSAETTAQLVGATASGYGYTDTGEKKTNGVDSGYGTAPATGQTIGVLLNLTDGEISFTLENVNQGVAFTGLSGTFFIAFSSGFSANRITANFGASAFTYPVPSGYNAGLYN